MRNKDTLTAAFSLACLEIRSRNEEGINLDCKQSLLSQSSLSWAGLQRAKWPRGKLESPLSFLFLLSLASLNFLACMTILRECSQSRIKFYTKHDLLAKSFLFPTLSQRYFLLVSELI